MLSASLAVAIGADEIGRVPIADPGVLETAKISKRLLPGTGRGSRTLHSIAEHLPDELASGPMVRLRFSVHLFEELVRERNHDFGHPRLFRILAGPYFLFAPGRGDGP